MGKRKKIKVSYTKKLAWLRKRHIIVKKGKVAKTTVNRLYTKFKIQKMPLSTPRDVAFGMHKRMQEKIERRGEKAIIRSPKGKVTAKEYIKKVDKETARQIIKEISPDITSMRLSHKFKSGKREDRFRYNFRGGKGVIVTSLTVDNVLHRLRTSDIPDLMESLDIFYKRRGKLFYRNRTIGALIIYETQNVPDDPIPRPVKFSFKEEFSEYLLDMLHELLITDILRNYKDAIIRLKYLDIFIRTRDKPSAIERF